MTNRARTAMAMSALGAALGVGGVAVAPAVAGAAESATAAATAPAPDTQPLVVGQVAPDFTAVAHDGKKVSLAALRGRPVVLYFYPKDDTPGCTKEACEFRDNWTKLQKLGVAVYGVSTQDNGSHTAFAHKYQLPFPLLPDEKGDLAAKYHVPVVDGKARRITYLIGKDGRISHVWPKVNPVGHAAEVLAALSTT